MSDVAGAQPDQLLFARFDARRLDLAVTQDDLRRLYLNLLLARLTDDRLASLRARKLLPGGPTCRGFEAAQVGCVEPLRIGQDYLLPYYRDLAAMLAIGMTPETILLNQLSRASDPVSGGRMRPAQWNSRALNVVSASGLVATQTLHAAGIAFAAKLRHEPTVTLTFFGDGATSEGDFHEALNFAGIQQLPVVFVCENNGVALSTPTALQMATQRVADRAAAYGMPGVVADGSDVFAVISAAREAFARARNGQGPTLLEIVIPRLAGPDDPRDPVDLFRRYLLTRDDLTPELDRRLRQQIADELDEAERVAFAAPPPDPASVGESLFAPTPSHPAAPESPADPARDPATAGEEVD
jgi:2-oxoisovalerate dehydrogenase E1 component alpha subunit